MDRDSNMLNRNSVSPMRSLALLCTPACRKGTDQEIVLLPQDQQMEIHEQLLQHMGDGPNAAAGSDFGIPADDVYNPDDPAFL